MRTLSITAISVALCVNAFCGEAAKPKSIAASAAREHIGEKAVVQGRVAEVHIAEKLVRLNFDQPFPRHTFTAVVFKTRTNAFGDLRTLKDKTVEVSGKIAEYRGRPEIIVSSTNQLKILEAPTGKK